MKTLIHAKEKRILVKLIGHIKQLSEYNIILEKSKITEELLSSAAQNIAYDLLIVEFDEVELQSLSMVKSIRGDARFKGLKIIALISLNSQYKLNEQATTLVNAILHKSYSNEQFEEIALNLGLEKPAGDAQSDGLSKDLINLKKLIYNKSRFSDQEFRIYVEDRVKKIGINAEKLLGEFICSDHLDVTIKINLVRVAGYLRTQTLLDYLEKSLKKKDNMTIIKEVIIAISKFNNMESMKILSASLAEIGNPMLIRKINEEIGKIKQNNPLLTLIPRFLEGDKDYKKFFVTVNIIKKIIGKDDIPTFLKHLSHQSPIISEGAFDILAEKGDKSLKEKMHAYFKRGISDTSCITFPDCPKLKRITKYYKTYLLRFVDLIPNIANDIKTVFEKAIDKDAKTHLIAIIANSPYPDDLDYVERIYQQEEFLKKEIIAQLAKNTTAVNLLYALYHSATEDKAIIIKGLLNTDKGSAQFLENFFTEDSETQETIIKYVTINNPEKKAAFVKQVFYSKLFSIKRGILLRVIDFYHASLKDILFDDKLARELYTIEKEYLKATAMTFPISLIDNLMHQIETASLHVSKITRFLSTIQTIQKQDPVIMIPSEDKLNRFVDAILNTNSADLNLMILTIFGNMNILNLRIYHILNKLLNRIQSSRGDKITAAEINKINAVKRHYVSKFKDLKKKDEFLKEFKDLIQKKPISFDNLRQVINYNHMPIAQNIDEFVSMIIDSIKKGDLRNRKLWTEFLKYFPLLEQIIHQQLYTTDKSSDSEDKKNMQIPKKFQHYIRIVISFSDFYKSALFFDQLSKILPEYRIIIDPPEIFPTDILICDSVNFKLFIENRELKTDNVFLLLENKVEYSSLKKYNAKFFVKPFSLNKVIHQLYQALYFIKIGKAENLQL